MGLLGDLKYDLAHNKINFQMESLKQQSLTLFIQKLCRDGFITHYIKRKFKIIWGSKEPYDIFKIGNEMAELLTKRNIFESDYFSPSDLNRFRTFINETVCFVAIQICDLLRKETVAKEEEMNISLLMRNLTITKQGTIDLKSTVHRILGREQLLPSHSCELACYYFITDEIINNHYQMVKYGASDYYVGHAKEKTIKESLDFWRCILRKFSKDSIKLALQDPNKMIKTRAVHMFDEAVRYNNEFGVHFLWNVYFSKVKDQKATLRKALKNSITYSSHINIRMFILFHMESNEIDKHFKHKYREIFIYIIQNIRWHFLFAITLKEHKIHLDSLDLLLILHSLTESLFIFFSTQISVIIDYINSLPNNAKRMILNHRDHLYKKALTKPFIHAKTDLVTSLLSLGHKFDLKNFMISISGNKLIVEAIKNGILEFVGNFLLERFTRSDIYTIKHNLYYYERETIYQHFIEIQQFEKISEVIDWLSDVIPDLYDFKNLMISKDNGLYLKQMIFTTNVYLDVNHFPSVDKFLLWCFKDKKLITSFKTNIILCPNQSSTGTHIFISCYDELKISILESKWNLLKKFFNWINFTLDKKRTFYQMLFNDNNFLSKIILEVRKANFFMESFIYFLMTQLILDNSDMNYIRGKILDAVVNKYPDRIADCLGAWYEKRISNDELLLYLEYTGIVFEDRDILIWLNPHDHML